MIKTDAGITGFGMGAGGSAAVEIIDGHLKHLLIGTDPLNVDQLWDQMYSSAVLYGRRGIFAMALSAVDTALWDIKGKHAGRSVHALLGGKP
ncbi:MAG: L-rhamnonate dehydratase, partial [Holophagales bacterium]|nr:L-rhamnonate dehydratase [Holophagales bacterium]